MADMNRTVAEQETQRPENSLTELYMRLNGLSQDLAELVNRLDAMGDQLHGSSGPKPHLDVPRPEDDKPNAIFPLLPRFDALHARLNKLLSEAHGRADRIQAAL